MLDNKLYKTRAWTQRFSIPGYEDVEVEKIEIRTLLTERELMPVFELPGADAFAVSSEGEGVYAYTGAQRRPRRMVCPFFEYDHGLSKVVGAEHSEPLDNIMLAVVDAHRDAKEEGFIPEGRYVHFHISFAGCERHLMAFIPGFDDLEWYFMVRAEIVPVIQTHPR